MFEFLKIRKQNEFLRRKIAKVIHENMQLRAKIKRLEYANEISAKAKWKGCEIIESEMYQRCLHGSEYTMKWCEGQIKKSILHHLAEIITPYIEFSTQVADEKHNMMFGRVTISMKEVEK